MCCVFSRSGYRKRWPFPKVSESHHFASAFCISSAYCFCSDDGLTSAGSMLSVVEVADGHKPWATVCLVCSTGWLPKRLLNEERFLSPPLSIETMVSVSGIWTLFHEGYDW